MGQVLQACYGGDDVDELVPRKKGEGTTTTTESEGKGLLSGWWWCLRTGADC